jgi:hypothetical protein
MKEYYFKGYLFRYNPEAKFPVTVYQGTFLDKPPVFFEGMFEVEGEERRLLKEALIEFHNIKDTEEIEQFKIN